MPLPSCLIHAAPADQPVGVAQVTALLYPAYTVDEGRVSLAGCTFEDRLVLKLCFACAGQKVQVYLNAEGREVDGQPVVGEPSPRLVRLDKPPESADADLERVMAAGLRLAAEHGPPDAQVELLAAEAVWCKYVEGKLRFAIGAATADLPFAGWARNLAAPPYVCPYTHTATFHLAATDDGRIAAAERIECCAETGRRMLTTELVHCSVTGRHVAPELMSTCPISGRRLLRTAMVECGCCRQPVSPAVVDGGNCLACRRMKHVGKADPRMARLLHEHPALDRWRHWKIGETARVYVLVASRWLQRLLVVVDKESLEFRHMAGGSRLSVRWQPIEPGQYSYVLRE